MENEKIYVVVPVYGVEAYLERCVESILNQTHDDYELILVDDGSPDNSPQICDRYGEKYGNITVIHQENGGLSAARNAGICHALKKGDPDNAWITFVDSDDFLHPCCLQYLLQAAREWDVPVSSCAYRKTSSSELEAVDPQTLTFYSITPEEYWYRDRTNAMIVPAKLYKLSCFREIRFPEGRLHEDEFTTYRVLFGLREMAVTAAPLYYYYFNDTSITHRRWHPRRLDALDALKEQADFFREKGYRQAYRVSVRDYLQHSIKHLMYIRVLSPEYDHLIPVVKKRQSEAFRLYCRETGLKNTLDYWFDVRIRRPSARVLERESVWSFFKRKVKKKVSRIRR